MKAKRETQEEQIKRYVASLQRALSPDFLWQHFSDTDINERFCEFVSNMNQAISNEISDIHGLFVDLKNGIK